MKIKIFIRNSLGVAALLLFFFTPFYSCKKIDTPTAKQLYAQKFFEKPEGSSPGLQAIIDLLRTENDKTGFVNSLPGNAGLPVWNKTISEKPKPNYAARGVLVDQNGNYLIPLSNDKKTLSALLFAMKKDGKYEFFCYDNNYAYQIVFNDQYSIKQRENIMGLFMAMGNYVFGITEFKSIPIELFAGMTGEKIEEGGKTKQMFLEPPKGIPPIILNSLGVIGTEETCVYKFSGQCNCGPDVVTNTSHCNDWWLGCPFCSVSDCQLLIFEEVPGIDPPPTNPNGGTGGTPSNGYPSWGEGQNLAGGPLTAPTNGSLPNAPCSNNCAWYTEAPEQNFETEPPCDPLMVHPEKAIFNEYIQMTTPISVVQGNNSVNGPDPIMGSYTWNVAEALFGSWKIEAVTNYGYYHYRFYTVNGTAEDNFDLFLFKTSEGYFVGSQTFITSTYTTRNPTTNQVLNNNTQNTSGTSRVIGTIEHTMKMSPISICDVNPELNFSDDVNNSTTFNPK